MEPKILHVYQVPGGTDVAYLEYTLRVGAMV
jgi:hypothetical protein